jgi:hypothetical protein
MSGVTTKRCKLLVSFPLLSLLLLKTCRAFVAAPDIFTNDRFSCRRRTLAKKKGPQRQDDADGERINGFLNHTHNGSQLNLNPRSSSLQYHHLTDITRVFCLSDLHTDNIDNMQWLREHVVSSSWSLSRSDLVIVAGDISHELSTFSESLQILCEKCQVLFVPGNHEAWLNQQERRELSSSLEKLDRFYKICRDHGVYVGPVYIEGTFPVWIFPLESWYDGTLSFDDVLCQGFEHWPWVDFARCRWDFSTMGPPNDRIPLGLAEYFLKRNRVNIIEPWRAMLIENDIKAAPVVTVSHFAPNQQCLPDWKDLKSEKFRTDAWLDHGAKSMSAKFAKVAGTALLDEQIRQDVMPRMHIFGHSHRPKDFVFRNVRYIHNPLGKPRERELQLIAPDVDFLCIWDVAVGEVKGDTVIRYWEERGGGTEMLWRRMAGVSLGRYQSENMRL